MRFQINNCNYQTHIKLAFNKNGMSLIFVLIVLACVASGGYLLLQKVTDTKKFATQQQRSIIIENIVNDIRIMLAKNNSCSSTLKSSTSNFSTTPTGVITEITESNLNGPIKESRYLVDKTYDGVKIINYRFEKTNMNKGLLYFSLAKDPKTIIEKSVDIKIFEKPIGSGDFHCRTIVNPEEECMCDGLVTECFTQRTKKIDPDDLDSQLVETCFPQKGWIVTGRIPVP